MGQYVSSYCPPHSATMCLAQSCVQIDPLTLHRKPKRLRPSLLTTSMTYSRTTLLGSGFIAAAIFTMILWTTTAAKVGLEVKPRQSKLGDFRRSDSSSASFFQSIDRDGDGTLRAPEVATFLRENIGGSSFDDADEVALGVKRVMGKLDRNHDDGLDKSDVFAYWRQLESLLTADEVADWVVYAVQLPEHIGHIFRENAVTGYDFPELVDRGGDALFTELGIKKDSFRKRITRLVQARMLGIGSLPTVPGGVQKVAEGCSMVRLTWKKSSAESFPVHSYRIQRRKIGASVSDNEKDMGQNMSRDEQGHREVIEGSTMCSPTLLVENDRAVCPAVGNSRVASRLTSPEMIVGNYATGVYSSGADWTTVYVGGENEFVDSGLEYGYEYVYRIQAWNSVGRSAWTTVKVGASFNKLLCTARKMKNVKSFFGGNTSMSKKDDHLSLDWSWWYTPWKFLTGVWFIVKCFFACAKGLLSLIALAAAILRYKRASALSTTTSLDPLCPWLWKRVDRFIVNTIGVEIVPKSLLGDENAIQQSSLYHDTSIKAVGLRGYKNNAKHTKRSSPTLTSSRRDDMAEKRSLSTECLPVLSGIRDESQRLNSDRQVLGQALRGLSTSNNGEKKEPLPQSLVSRNPFWRKKPVQHIAEQFGDTLCIPVREMSNAVKGLSDDALFSRESSHLTEEDRDSANSLNSLDDYERCNTCRKKYKFPKRWRHHCARCTATFCHKHGRTTHSSLVACGVPGNCVCNKCLEDQFHFCRSGSSFR